MYVIDIHFKWLTQTIHKQCRTWESLNRQRQCQSFTSKWLKASHPTLMFHFKSLSSKGSPRQQTQITRRHLIINEQLATFSKMSSPIKLMRLAEQHPQLTHSEVENGNAFNSHFMIILYAALVSLWDSFKKASKLSYACKLSWFRHYDKHFLNFKHAKRRRCLLKYIKSWQEFDILTGEIITNNYQFLMTWNRFSCSI